MAHTYRRPPISAHRLFPMIVAIWFAALFGLGCLVLPAVLLERAADASRIAEFIPAAAPPLGLTARIALAAMAGVFGAVLGFAIAGRVAKAQAPAPPVDFDRLLRAGDEAPAERVRRPISASEELGDARLDTPAAAPVEAAFEEPPVAVSPLLRRRQLALPEEPTPDHASAWADEHPLMPSAAALAEKAMALPGLDRTEFAHEPAPEPEPEPDPEPQPEARRFDEPPAPAGPVDEAEPEQAPQPYAETQPIWHEPVGADDNIAAPAPETFAEPAAPFVAEAEEPASVLTAAEAPSEPPLAFAAPSQAKPPVAAVRSRAALAEPLRALLAGEAVPTDKVGGPLEHLGMAELAERLARSMHNYDSRQAPPATEPEPEAPAAAPVNFTPPPPVIPDALRPFAPELEEFGEDEEDEAFAAPLDSPFAAPPPARNPTPVTDDASENDGEETDEIAEELDSASYGSLLEMAGAPRPFDAPAGADRQAAGPKAGRDPAETERALRSALATLQRMSGAA